MFTFKKPKNDLEALLQTGSRERSDFSADLFVNCPSCGKSIIAERLSEYLHVCPKCDHHMKLRTRTRLRYLLDTGSFSELDADLTARNDLEFPEYEEKLTAATASSGEKDAVITGTGKIKGMNCCLFAMEGNFMMGSMGCVVGEKITRLFEHATRHRLPVIGYTVSGGARMQEGILSLMQMAKTSGAVKRHSDEGLLYIAVLTNPTTGGVTASFAMEGDIILAEPNALICFAGPRVIEQTTRQKLPPGFQRAEFLLENGFLDAIVHRSGQRDYLARLLRFHKGGVSL